MSYTFLERGMSWEEFTAKVMEETGIQSPEFKNWMLKRKVLKQNYFSSVHYARCYMIWRAIHKKNLDHFMVIEGKEGVGKSTLGAQTAAVIDLNFNKSKVCYSPLKFLRGLKTAKRGDVFLLDEGNLFLFSRNAMTDGNKDMVVLFALMRQRGVCVIICVPNFFTLDSYVREHRVATLAAICNRGNFKCITVDRSIKTISKEGAKKSRSVFAVRVPYGTFYEAGNNSKFPVINDLNEESYLEEKAETFDEFLEELEHKAMSKDGASEWVPLNEVSKYVPVSKQTLYRMVKNQKIESKQFGGKWFISRSALETMED